MYAMSSCSAKKLDIERCPKECDWVFPKITTFWSTMTYRHQAAANRPLSQSDPGKKVPDSTGLQVGGF